MEAKERFALLPVITGIFVAIQALLPSMASKFVALGPLYLPGSSLIFPINFIFNDILTEVYGYERSRRIIWLGFAAQVLAAVMYAVIQYLPAAPFWHNQDAYEKIFAQTPRIVLASLLAGSLGEFANSFVISRMKFLQKGRLGAAQAGRFVASTVVGQFVNSFVYMLSGFTGVVPLPGLIKTIVTMWLFKSIYEIIVLPFSMRFSNWIKRREGVDHIDARETTRYSPFHF
jgi:uncharacterized integral membrane protein (TIGR00697 family)